MRNNVLLFVVGVIVTETIIVVAAAQMNYCSLIMCDELCSAHYIFLIACAVVAVAAVVAFVGVAAFVGVFVVESCPLAERLHFSCTHDTCRLHLHTDTDTYNAEIFKFTA